MRYPYFFVLILFLLGHKVQGQVCTCQESFQDLTTYVEENYALYSFKVSEAKQNTEIYEALKGGLIEESQNTVLSDCPQIYNAYVNYFNDQHMWVNPRASALDQKAAAVSEIIDIDTVSLFTQWKAQPPSDPLVGVWESDAYKVVIVEETDSSKKRKYVAVVLSSINESWGYGEVKMEIDGEGGGVFEVAYYMGNREKNPVSMTLKDGKAMELTGLGSWRKLSPLAEGEEVVSWGDLVPELEVKDLGDRNYYIKIETFNSSMEEPVKNFVTEYHDKLIKANTLIIDVRDNGGGNDYTYHPLLPYIYSGPVQIPNLGLRMSDENKKLFRKWVSDVDDLDELGEVELKFIEALDADENRLYYMSEEVYTEVETDTVFAHPRYVAIIANEGSGSSAETFVYNCSQSDRVLTFGQTTAGVVDGFNGNDIVHDCFSLRYPTSVRSRNLQENAIDPHGLTPDVYLSEDQKDVAQFIIRFFKHLDQ